MKRPGRAFLLALALLAPLAVEAQPSGTILRIGFLRTVAPPESYIEAFRQGLKDRGYTEGKDVAFEYRWAGGKTDRLPGLATELVQLKVDVIVTDGTPPRWRPGRRATQCLSSWRPVAIRLGPSS